MQTITIDHDKCTVCLNCTSVCPPQILQKGQNDRITMHHRERCVSCGHCAAVCPAGAITSHPENGRLPFIVQPLPEDLPPEHSPFLSKRSIRAYGEQPLDKQTIERLIEYGERAPSGHNFRGCDFWISKVHLPEYNRISRKTGHPPPLITISENIGPPAILLQNLPFHTLGGPVRGPNLDLSTP